MTKQIQGKKNRAKGLRFENSVRKELESNGFVVDRWTNNVEFFGLHNGKSYYGKLIKAKSFMGRSRTNGFPDFIAIKKNENNRKYSVIAVECKGGGETNKYLSKEEKEKCRWYLKNNIFSKILIANRGEKRGEIIYKEFI